MNSNHDPGEKGASGGLQAVLQHDSLQSLVDWITEATAPIVGDDFFRSLIELLATRLEVDTALLTQCVEGDHGAAETLAFWQNGRFKSNIEFELAGTPCEQVIDDGQFCFVPEGVRKHFPGWARDQGDVESYIGIPVLCPNTGEVLGHIAIYDRRPMPHAAVAQSMFRIAAARAGAEIRRRQTEKARMEQQQLAEQRLHELAVISRRTSVSEMAAAITHEIRQPLTSMKTYLETALKILERGDADPGLLHKAMKQSLESVERGQAIIDRLRQWVDSTETRMESIDARALVEETGHLLASEFARANAVLELELADELPDLTGDPVLLQQVVFNLLRNSLEAVMRAGSEDSRVVLKMHADETDQLVIEIHDNGSGVPDSLTEKIFLPFSGTRDEGMGIGLSLCHSIVESHGGKLELVSPHDPTVFRVTLPGQAAAATASEAAS